MSTVSATSSPTRRKSAKECMTTLSPSYDKRPMDSLVVVRNPFLTLPKQTETNGWSSQSQHITPELPSPSTCSTSSTHHATYGLIFPESELGREDLHKELAIQELELNNQSIHNDMLEERHEKMMAQFKLQEREANRRHHELLECIQQQQQEFQKQQQEAQQQLQQQQQENQQQLQRQLQRQLQQQQQETQRQLHQQYAAHQRSFDIYQNVIENRLSLRVCVSEFESRLASYMLANVNQSQWFNMNSENQPEQWKCPNHVISLISDFIKSPTRGSVPGVQDMVVKMREFLTMYCWPLPVDDDAMLDDIKIFIDTWKQPGNDIAHTTAYNHAVQLSMDGTLVPALEFIGVPHAQSEILKIMIDQSGNFQKICNLIKQGRSHI